MVDVLVALALVVLIVVVLVVLVVLVVMLVEVVDVEEVDVAVRQGELVVVVVVAGAGRVVPVVVVGSWRDTRTVVVVGGDVDAAAWLRVVETTVGSVLNTVDVGSRDIVLVATSGAPGPIVVLSAGAARTCQVPPDAGDAARSATSTRQIAIATNEIASAGRLWKNWTNDRANNPFSGSMVASLGGVHAAEAGQVVPPDGDD